MLYTFGDSFTWGTGLADRENEYWPKVLARLLNQPLRNFSQPGGNNWYISRKINELHLAPDDICVIGWTNPDRFELPAADYIVNEYNPVPTDRPDFLDSVSVKKFYPGQIYKNKQAQALNKIIYTDFYNEHWFYEHFKICLQSVCWKLENAACRYLMFYPWAWWPDNYSKEHELYNDNFVDWPNSAESQKKTYINGDGHYDAATHATIAKWLFDKLT